MKNASLLILSIIFIQCGKKNVDLPFTTQTVIKNNLQNNIELIIYSDGPEIQDVTINPSEVFKYTSPYKNAPQGIFNDQNYIEITINGKKRKDVNCVKYEKSKNFTCPNGPVNLFNKSLYSIVVSGDTTTNTYLVDTKDSLSVF